MRKNFITCAVLTAAMILMPLVSMNRKAEKTMADTAVTAEDEGIISVMLSENGKVERLSEREYLIGALAAEMNISCHEEALKAQTVACATYAKYIKENSNENFNGADISDDSGVHQGYLNKKQRQEKWGEKFEENEKKAEKAVDSVLGKYMYYDNKIIKAVYHNISSGRTESAETVWGENIPYLMPEESAGDKLSTDYSSTVVLSENEFRTRAETIKNVSLGDDSSEWIDDIEVNDNGYVSFISVGGIRTESSAFRKAFKLRSCNFTVSCDDGQFEIKTRGHGHLVGMSQYGADYMARQGAGWEAILKHYYSKIKIM